jgi:hypothetical protein
LSAGARDQTHMVLELSQEQLGVLRRALEARVRDMHTRLGGDPGDEGFGAKQDSRHSFCDRSKLWKGNLVIALGESGRSSLCRKETRTEWKQAVRLTFLSSAV